MNTDELELMDELDEPSGRDRENDSAETGSSQKPNVITIEEFEKFRRESHERQAALEREAREARQVAEFVRQQALGTAPQPAAAQPRDPEDWLSEIESKGAAAFAGRFVTPDQIESIKAEMRREIAAREERVMLQSQYPDLFKEGSEFRNRVDELLTQPTFTPFVSSENTKLAAVRLAADMVKQEFSRREQGRTSRQMGAGANRPMSGSGPTGSGRPTTLTAAQRAVAEAMGLTEKQMLESVSELSEEQER